MNIKNIIIASDHAGYDLKEKLKEFLTAQNYNIKDMGVYSKESCDYPVIARRAAEETAASGIKAVLICGTGIGMSIAANKVKEIRAAVCSDVTSAAFSRKHNNSNILCLGARIIGEAAAIDILKSWLEAEFEGGRHQKRIDMIE